MIPFFSRRGRLLRHSALCIWRMKHSTMYINTQFDQIDHFTSTHSFSLSQPRVIWYTPWDVLQFSRVLLW